MPAAIRYGIAADVFWTLNPKTMYLHQEEYIRDKEEQIKFMDAAAYYQGLYVKQAIASCFNKNTKYPKKPLSFKQEEQKKIDNMTEEEYYAAMRSAIAGMNSQFE